jgi:hypothetical protein
LTDDTTGARYKSESTCNGSLSRSAVGCTLETPSYVETTTLFAVIRTSGDAWVPSVMEEQSQSGTYAAFMNGLESEGFMVLGGPM